MVRVGGGWVALDEFLVKNDPCRGEFVHVNFIPYIIKIQSNNIIQLVFNRWPSKSGINNQMIFNNNY